MTFFITGATGHLGYHLVRRLIAQKHTVYALVLPHDPLSKSLPPEVIIVEGNILDESSMDRWLNHPHDGYRVLIHAASRVTTQMRKDTLTYRVNVEGTQHILNQAHLHHFDHVIYVSSVHALKEFPVGEAIDETHIACPREVKGFYAKTKAEATQMVWRDHLMRDFPVSIVFPAGFIGPNDLGKGYTTLMIKEAMQQRMNIWFKGGYDFVDVRDVADAIITIAETKRIGQAYVLNHAFLPFNTLMKMIDEANGHHPIRVYIPRWLIWFAIPFLKIYYWISGKKPLLTYYAFQTMQTNAIFDHSKATIDFGFQPRPFMETIQDTVDDLKKQS